MMIYKYKCLWTGKVILEVDAEAVKHVGGETPCPDCKESHPLAVLPREVVR